MDTWAGRRTSSGKDDKMNAQDWVNICMTIILIPTVIYIWKE